MPHHAWLPGCYISPDSGPEEAKSNAKLTCNHAKFIANTTQTNTCSMCFCKTRNKNGSRSLYASLTQYLCLFIITTRTRSM